jgi:hypothetical protein
MDYSAPGVFTSLSDDQLPFLDGLPDDPVGICTAVRDLVIQPPDAAAIGVPEERIAEERAIRPARNLVGVLTSLRPAPLAEPRTPDRRVVGTCRHFATLATALLRARGVTARARCGFATYFVPGRSVDHWVVEYQRDGRWVRVDIESLGGTRLERPDDLVPGQFLTGGESWTLYRAGSVDPDTFGVDGTEHAWGVGEIRANAVRDLASLNGLEMLPWDEWGRITDSFQGRTGPEYDALLDRVAAVCAKDDPVELAALYASEDLTVPAEMLG